MEFKSLKSLPINSDQIGDETIVTLKNLEGLKTLTLSRSKVTAKGLEELSEQRELTCLHLSKNKIGEFNSS